jgi:hypothetical protein
MLRPTVGTIAYEIVDTSSVTTPLVPKPEASSATNAVAKNATAPCYVVIVRLHVVSKSIHEVDRTIETTAK